MALAAVGCSSAAENLAGEYRVRMPEVASALLLRPDGNFEYFFTYGAADYTSKGKWHGESGAVVLDAEEVKEPALRLARSGAGTPDEFRVRVQGKNGRGVAHIEVAAETAGGVIEERTDQEGVALFPMKDAVKSVRLHVPVYDIEAGPFAVTGSARELVFEINGDAIVQVPFRGERLRMVDGALELTYWKGPKPLRYVKR